MMRRKYFFFDIDGTLLVGKAGEQYVPESTTRALRSLEANGHFVALATGRSQAMAVDVMHSFGMRNMVSDGGYGITINDELLEIRPLDKQLCLQLIDECRQHDFPWAFSPDNKRRRLAPDERFSRFTNDRYMPNEVVPGLDPAGYDVIYKVYVACLSGQEERLQALKKLPWCRFDREYIFVEPCNKSEGIRRIMEHLNGDLSDVVVFGDNNNDLSMFCPEWTSIAMGNATDALKAQADYITTDAADDGIYNACRHFNWI